jgi:predicted metal-dependent peptidase
MSDALSNLEEAVRRKDAEERAVQAARNARSYLVLGRSPQDHRVAGDRANAAFFACLAMRLEVQVNWDVPTLGTDGKTLVVNPDFFLQHKVEEQVGLMVHEVMHCVLKHPSRLGDRDPELANVAMDLAINGQLLETGYLLPLPRLVPGEGEYKQLPRGKSFEEYYSLLQQQPPGKRPKGGPEGDPGGCGAAMRAGGKANSPAAEAETAADWEVATQQAARMAKQKGELAAGLAALVEQATTRKVDWKAVLREFVSKQARNDYRWMPPSRRHIHDGLYLPGMRSDEMGDLIVLADTSGSVWGSPELLRQFASEIEGIGEAFNAGVTIGYHDTEIQHVQKWHPQDGPLVLEAQGGGGTSHVQPLAWAEQQAGDSPCIVALTDLYTEFPDTPPGLPVLWCVVENDRPKAPFGQIVEVS